MAIFRAYTLHVSIANRYRKLYTGIIISRDYNGDRKVVKASVTLIPCATASLALSSMRVSFGIISMTGPSSSRGITTTPSSGSQKTISPYHGMLISVVHSTRPESIGNTHRRNSDTLNGNRHIASSRLRLRIRANSRSTTSPDLVTTTNQISTCLYHNIIPGLKRKRKQTGNPVTDNSFKSLTLPPTTAALIPSTFIRVAMIPPVTAQYWPSGCSITMIEPIPGECVAS